MTTKLSQKQNDTTGTKPSSYYVTRVMRARELLSQAAEADLDYQGDMMAEAYREALMTSATMILDKLIEVSTVRPR